MFRDAYFLSRLTILRRCIPLWAERSEQVVDSSQHPLVGWGRGKRGEIGRRRESGVSYLRERKKDALPGAPRSLLSCVNASSIMPTSP